MTEMVFKVKLQKRKRKKHNTEKEDVTDTDRNNLKTRY